MSIKRRFFFLFLALFLVFMVLSSAVDIPGDTPQQTQQTQQPQTPSPSDSTTTTTTPSSGGWFSNLFKKETAEQQLARLKAENEKLRAENSKLQGGSVKAYFDMIFVKGKYLIAPFFLLYFLGTLIGTLLAWAQDKSAWIKSPILFLNTLLSRGGLIGHAIRYGLCFVLFLTVANIPPFSWIMSFVQWFVFNVTLLVHSVFNITASFTSVLICIIVGILIFVAIVWLIFRFIRSFLEKRGITTARSKGRKAGRAVAELESAGEGFEEGSGMK